MVSKIADGISVTLLFQGPLPTFQQAIMSYDPTITTLVQLICSFCRPGHPRVVVLSVIPELLVHKASQAQTGQKSVLDWVSLWTNLQKTWLSHNQNQIFIKIKQICSESKCISATVNENCRRKRIHWALVLLHWENSWWSVTLKSLGSAVYTLQLCYLQLKGITSRMYCRCFHMVSESRHF